MFGNLMTPIVSTFSISIFQRALRRGGLRVIAVVPVLIHQLGGSSVDGLAFMIPAAPVFFPVAEMPGFDPGWFFMPPVLTMLTGWAIPAVASGVFKNITKVPPGTICEGATPFHASPAAATIPYIFPSRPCNISSQLFPEMKMEGWFFLDRRPSSSYHSVDKSFVDNCKTSTKTRRWGT
jgi:TRAP-type C4-dicarboxylate transport system permease large subunit